MKRLSIDAGEHARRALRPNNQCELKIKTIILDYVRANYGVEESLNPSWNISALAKHLNFMFPYYGDKS